jgi:NAD(P)H-hydrate epimerase
MEAPAVLSREQVRRVDSLAVAKYGMSSLVLMENAGRGVVDELLAKDPALLDSRPLGDVIILCGKGNNAGDGFVIARHLSIRGVPSIVHMLCPPIELSPDARRNWDLLAGCPGVVSLCPANPGANESLDDVPWKYATESAWIIDAMLGTGATGEPREPFAKTIKNVNACPCRCLAVDLPSGLDCDTGVPASNTVRADVTCTFVALKPGFLEESAKPYLGDVHVVSIGLPPRLVREAAGV